MRLHFEDGERAALVAQLGLDDSADENALVAAVTERLQNTPTPPGPGNTPPPPDGEDYAVIDITAFQRMQADRATAAQVVEQNRRRDRDELIECAITDGKFGPARREHYRERYDSDPDATTALIGRLMANTVPLEERGNNAPTDEAADVASYDKSWVPEVQQRQVAAAQAGQQAPSRVHGEV